MPSTTPTARATSASIPQAAPIRLCPASAVTGRFSPRSATPVPRARLAPRDHRDRRAIPVRPEPRGRQVLQELKASLVPPVLKGHKDRQDLLELKASLVPPVLRGHKDRQD